MKYFDYDAYIKQLEELVSIDSGSFDPEGVDKVAEAMARKYEELGLTVTKSVSMSVPVTVWKLRNYPEEGVYRYFNGRPHGYRSSRREQLQKDRLPWTKRKPMDRVLTT